MPHPPSPLRVVVSDLVRNPGNARPFRSEVAIDYAADLARLPSGAPVYADLLLRGISGGLMVDGTVAFTADLSCHRCLKTWRSEDSRRILQLVEDPADEDAEYALDGDEVDLEPLIRDEVILALPLAPLCREDCVGLCPVCGADLNTDACPGHAEESPSPFAGLRDLLETQE